MVKITEMAYDRSDAINRCAKVGKQFVNHFNKVMASGGMNDPDFIYHCDAEMASWLDDVRKIVLKYNHKRLNSEQLMDWFLQWVAR